MPARFKARDFEDAAIGDPLEARAACSKSDVKKVGQLWVLDDSRQPAWRLISGQASERGRDALGFLVDQDGSPARHRSKTATVGSNPTAVERAKRAITANETSCNDGLSTPGFDGALVDAAVRTQL